MKQRAWFQRHFSKIKFNDSTLWKQYLSVIAVISSIITLISFFITAQNHSSNIIWAGIFVFLLIAIFIYLWYQANQLKEANLTINQTKVNVKVGDIFTVQEGELNVIAFNDFFDTIVDNRIIAKESLHGKFLKRVENWNATRIGKNN